MFLVTTVLDSIKWIGFMLFAAADGYVVLSDPSCISRLKNDPVHKS